MMTISQIKGRDWATVTGTVDDAVDAIKSRWAQHDESSEYEVLEDGKRIAIVRPAPEPRHPWAASVEMV